MDRSKFLGVAVAAAIIGSCVPSEPSRSAQVATTARGLDVDSDGLTDSWELGFFGNLAENGAGDYDSDGMTNLEEETHGFDPTVDEGLEDPDGDRYPSVFEVRQGSDPLDDLDTPVPNYVVDALGGGDFLSIYEAIDVTDIYTQEYMIIAVRPGIYTGSNNTNLNLAAYKPALLIIGLEGATKTIVDGGGSAVGWQISKKAVISSLTIRRTTRALYVNAPSSWVRLVDTILVNNQSPDTYAGGVDVFDVDQLDIASCTLLDNRSVSGAPQLHLDDGTTHLSSTVVWNNDSDPLIDVAGGATLITDHSLIGGETLSGTGDLAGSTDPMMRRDGRLLHGSPLIGASGPPGSQFDRDLETRSSTAADIGSDEWIDAEHDWMADGWELEHAGNLTTLTSLTQDADSDGLTNDEEYLARTNPVDDDTDDDGLTDGDEINSYSTDPMEADSDGDDMPDGWEVSVGLDPTIRSGLDDLDGDRYPNVFEYVKSTDPTDAESIPAADAEVDPANSELSPFDAIYSSIYVALLNIDSGNGEYQIVSIAPGTYASAYLDLGVIIAPEKPTLLVIGIGGAAKTIVDGGGVEPGWSVSTSAVLSGITFRNTTRGLYVSAPGKEVRLVDMLFNDNRPRTGTEPGAIVLANSGAASLDLSGCTFRENTTVSGSAEQIYLGADTRMTNTVVWGSSDDEMVETYYAATLTTSYSQIKGVALAGPGDLDGDTDPRIRFDGRLASDSPLHGAGLADVGSKLDMDLEVRTSTSTDIGVDQWHDGDEDDLPDRWEIEVAGDRETLDGMDADGDQLSDLAEYDYFNGYRGADPLEPDTDGDRVEDGYEALVGTDVLVRDSDDLTTDNNGDGIIDSLGIQLGYLVDDFDDDGDSISNAAELVNGTDPLRPDTDGDGFDDDVDAFPLDPALHALVTDPMDVTAPVITLVTPANAVVQ